MVERDLIVLLGTQKQKRESRERRENRKEQEFAPENLFVDKCADRHCILASQC